MDDDIRRMMSIMLETQIHMIKVMVLDAKNEDYMPLLKSLKTLEELKKINDHLK